MELKGPERRFVASSAFRYGDKTSFKIFLEANGNRYLPGKHDPRTYLDRCGIKSIKGDVAVICPGNGGLAIEALHRGAPEVYMFEPRSVYNNALNGVISLTEVDSRITTNLRYPNGYEYNKKFDIIIWSDNFDVSLSPEYVFRNVVNMLSDNGTLVIEVNHGNNTNHTPGNINNWKPTKDTFKKFVNTIASSFSVEDICLGRFDNRVVYKIQSDIVIVMDDDKSLAEDDKNKTSKKKKRTNKKKDDGNKKSAIKKISKIRNEKAKKLTSNSS